MEGFKQTEIGTIPKGWEVKEIGECLRLVKKQNPVQRNVKNNPALKCGACF